MNKSKAERVRRQAYQHQRGVAPMPDRENARVPAMTALLMLVGCQARSSEGNFGFGQTQPEMLNALVVFIEGDDIGNSFFLTIIVTNDELQFDAHREASPGSSDR